MSNIDNFKSAIATSGLSNLSNFSCIITSPTGQANQSRELQARIEMVDIVGRNSSIIDDVIGGFPTKVVIGSTMNELPISIILSSDLREKKFFEEWQDLAVGNYRLGQINKFMYNPKFYNDYVGTVSVMVEDETGKVSHLQNYIEAYPAIVGNVTYSWENGQAIAKLPVTIIFKRYENGDNQ